MRKMLKILPRDILMSRVSIMESIKIKNYLRKMKDFYRGLQQQQLKFRLNKL